MTQHFRLSKGEKTAEQICNAGVILFAKQGYAATSMREIAREAGIGAAAIYNHYPSKQDLLFHILEGHMSALLEDWAKVECRDEPLGALEDFINFHFDYHKDKSLEVFLSYMELRSLEPDNLAAIRKERGQYEEILLTILRQGAAEEIFIMPDINITSKAIIGMLAGVSDWYQPEGRLGLDEIKTIYWQIIRQMIGATGGQYV